MSVPPAHQLLSQLHLQQLQLQRAKHLQRLRLLHNTATVGDGSCKYVGCMDSTAFNYDQAASLPGLCTPKVFGCTDSTADTFYASANVDTGGCIFLGSSRSTLTEVSLAYNYIESLLPRFEPQTCRRGAGRCAWYWPGMSIPVPIITMRVRSASEPCGGSTLTAATFLNCTAPALGLPPAKLCTFIFNNKFESLRHKRSIPGLRPLPRWNSSPVMADFPAR